MDLRKLRDYPDAKLPQFKRKLKISRPFFFILCIILSLSLLTFAYLQLRERNQIQQNPLKIYKVPEFPNLQESVKNPASERVTVKTDADLSSETFTNTLPTEKSPVENILKNNIKEEAAAAASTTPIDSKQSSDKQKNTADEEARKRAETLKAAADQTLLVGNEILQHARNTMKQTAPIIASHLNTLSQEEQIKFLKQVRTQIYSQSIPEVQELIDKSPELVEQGWQTFLDLLNEYGYTPPKGIE
jgi:DNA polymerase III gamma/tau subunit